MERQEGSYRLCMVSDNLRNDLRFPSPGRAASIGAFEGDVLKPKAVCAEVILRSGSDRLNEIFPDSPTAYERVSVLTKRCMPNEVYN